MLSFRKHSHEGSTNRGPSSEWCYSWQKKGGGGGSCNHARYVEPLMALYELWQLWENWVTNILYFKNWRDTPQIFVHTHRWWGNDVQRSFHAAEWEYTMMLLTCGCCADDARKSARWIWIWILKILQKTSREKGGELHIINKCDWSKERPIGGAFSHN